MGNKLDDEITLRGENYSSDLAGEQYSVGREVLAGILMVTSLGIPLMLEVLIDFAGGKKTLSGTTFPWLLAEDNPVISWWGNNF